MRKIVNLILLAFLSMNFCATAQKVVNHEPICTFDCKECRKLKEKYRKEHGITKAEADRIAKENAAKRAKQEKLDAELDSMLNIDYSKGFVDIAKEYVYVDPLVWNDDEVIVTPIDTLKSVFRTSKSTTGGDTRYLHKEINDNYKENDVYLYFNTTNGVPDPIRFVVHYYADDAVDFEKLIFTINNKTFEYVPKSVNRTRDGIYYAENIDVAFGPEQKDLVAALAHGYYAHMSLYSKKVSHRIFFNKKHLDHFKRTYELYRLMGGTMDK